ncbi:larval cuticle protein 65Ag1-like [Leguminivora glycinivorella]|uniref:larval cuticle protein 65Ag1-like n=1 Tax=Leguminivora glycinivorella TaxID=1035111 RepID=UPI00200E849B|nr:larval cuticle protein 65Ag1-like [Leguminivora glycinivorella]
MKLLILCCLVATAFAAPAAPSFNPADAQVVRYDSEVNPDGFRYAVEQTDGSRSEAQGSLVKVGEDVALAIKGVFSFIIDGVTYTVNYTADENGYQPTIEQGPGGAVPPGVVASLLG